MFWSIIGLITVIYVFSIFIKRLGKTLPVLELLLLIAGLQWIVGSFIEYRTDFLHYKYSLYYINDIFIKIWYDTSVLVLKEY